MMLVPGWEVARKPWERTGLFLSLTLTPKQFTFELFGTMTQRRRTSALTKSVLAGKPQFT